MEENTGATPISEQQGATNMGSDMVVALKEASANGTTLFGLNHYGLPTQRRQLQRIQGQCHDLGDVIQTGHLQLPQARQTYTVLGMQAAGQWGLTHGINEHRVVTGVTHWRSRMESTMPALSGPDLVRLTLERSRSAHHAIDVLTDLIGRHGQGPSEEDAVKLQDHIFLIADREEAYVVEATGRFWALLECRHTRAVTETAMIRQDWRRLAPGLADHVIRQGWWPDDGSKVDFVRCLGENSEPNKSAQRRWGRASLALAQQQGAIDLHFLRRMLAEHYENNLDLLPADTATALTNSFLVDLHKAEQPIVAWVAFGAPRVALYFPICMMGDVPAAFRGGHPESPTIEQRTRELEKLGPGKPKDRNKLTMTLEKLQVRFDQDVEEFLGKAHACMHQGNERYISQLATEMMQSHVELFEKEYRQLFNMEEKPQRPAQEPAEMLFFA